MKTSRLPPQDFAPRANPKKDTKRSLEYSDREATAGVGPSKRRQIPEPVDKNDSKEQQKISNQVMNSVKDSGNLVPERVKETFVNQLIAQKKKLNSTSDIEKVVANPKEKHLEKSAVNDIADSSDDDSGPDEWVYARNRGGGKIL